MKKDFILNGVRVGEYDFKVEDVKEDVQKRCIDRGMNFVEIDLNRGDKPAAEYIEDFVKFLKDNKIYFTFNTDKTTIKPHGVDDALAAKLKEIAGEYYYANEVSETGSEFGCKGSGYGVTKDVDDMVKGNEFLADAIKERAQKANMGGIVKVLITEATGLVTNVISVNAMDYVNLEAMCGNPDVMIPAIRGGIKSFNKDWFGTYIAHEWYGGTRNFDILKRKRLRMIYDYSYLSGSRHFVIESGDYFLHSHDVRNFKNRTVDDTEIVQNYNNVITDFAKFVNEDNRPAGGPRVKVAFVRGNLDGYSDWRGGSSLWNQWGKKEFGYSAPEFCWRILNDVYAKRGWGDVHNFGDNDLSNAPAYGMYDIIPATASAEAMSKYDYLIFVGWNTMTDEIYENLKTFVSGGGKLFISAAHLNTNDTRDGKLCLIKDGNVEDLFGCRLDAKNSYCINDGFRFEESIVPGILYPASKDFDPILSEGYANYAKAELTSGVCSCMLTQSFLYKEEDREKPAVIENKLGEGYTILLSSLDYPSESLYPIYRTIVREMLQASHREADIKVISNDKIRFSVYEGNKMYLLNTDFDCKSYAKILYKDKVTEVWLDPCELKIIEQLD